MNGPRTSPRRAGGDLGRDLRCASVIASGVSRGNLACIVRIIRLAWWRNLLLGIHFAIAAFIVGGLIPVWPGAARGWGWVRNPWFAICTWRDRLRRRRGAARRRLPAHGCGKTSCAGGLRPESFIGRWTHRLLYYHIIKNNIRRAFYFIFESNLRL